MKISVENEQLWEWKRNIVLWNVHEEWTSVYTCFCIRNLFVLALVRLSVAYVHTCMCSCFRTCCVPRCMHGVDFVSLYKMLDMVHPSIASTCVLLCCSFLFFLHCQALEMMIACERRGQRIKWWWLMMHTSSALVLVTLVDFILSICCRLPLFCRLFVELERVRAFFFLARCTYRGRTGERRTGSELSVYLSCRNWVEVMNWWIDGLTDWSCCCVRTLCCFANSTVAFWFVVFSCLARLFCELFYFLICTGVEEHQNETMESQTKLKNINQKN